MVLPLPILTLQGNLWSRTCPRRHSCDGKGTVEDTTTAAFAASPPSMVGDYLQVQPELDEGPVIGKVESRGILVPT